MTNKHQSYWEFMRGGGKPRKLIINGHAQHGKDYFADAVSREFGLTKLNASMWFAEKVLVPAYPDMYPCVEAAYLDRVNHRALWYQMMRIGDWQQKFMQHSDIFCGHRNIQEHQEMVAHLEPQGVVTVWVEWINKAEESPDSTEWTDRLTVLENHDLILTHNGFGVDRMIRRLKEKMNGDNSTI